MWLQQPQQQQVAPGQPQQQPYGAFTGAGQPQQHQQQQAASPFVMAPPQQQHHQQPQQQQQGQAQPYLGGVTGMGQPMAYGSSPQPPQQQQQPQFYYSPAPGQPAQPLTMQQYAMLANSGGATGGGSTSASPFVLQQPGQSQSPHASQTQQTHYIATTGQPAFAYAPAPQQLQQQQPQGQPHQQQHHIMPQHQQQHHHQPQPQQQQQGHHIVVGSGAPGAPQYSLAGTATAGAAPLLMHHHHQQQHHQHHHQAQQFAAQPHQQQAQPHHFYAMAPPPQQQGPMVGQPAGVPTQPQVVLLPNGQYALLQPSPQPLTNVTPGPAGMSASYPSPPRVGIAGAGGSLTVMPPNSGGLTPNSIVVAGNSQSQLTMPIFVTPSVGNPPLEPSSGAGSPGGSTSRTPAQLGASLHNASSSATRPQSDPALWGYAVVDPYHTALQRVPVPPSVVASTRGTQTYNNDVSLSSTKPCTSHVCLRYITPAGCPLGENCASFHVAGTYIEASRSTTDPLCCGLHNDYFTQEMMRAGCAPHMPDSKFTLVLDDRSEVELLPAQLAFTVGLEQLSIRGNSRIIHIRKQVCRLHLDGRCKWTKDCGHVHLCRELHRLLSTFHYPSLVFLLSTETDDDKLSLKLNEVKEFIRSRSCMPLTHQLIATKRAAAVLAMCRTGALFTPEMAEAALQNCGLQVPAELQLPATDFATEAIHPERRAKVQHHAVAPSTVAASAVVGMPILPNPNPVTATAFTAGSAAVGVIGSPLATDQRPLPTAPAQE